MCAATYSSVLDLVHVVDREALVGGAVHGALGAGAVVADDHVDQRVVEDAELLQRVEQPADVVVGVGEEPGVHLHLAGECRLERVAHLVPGRDAGAALGEYRVGRDDAEFLLPGEGLLADLVPALVELAGVLVRPFGGDMVRRVGGARGEVGEERLVRGERLLLPGPVDRLVGHVVHEVVALLGRSPRLDRRRVLVDRRVPLVGLAADEIRRSTRSRRRDEASGRTARPRWPPRRAPRDTCRTVRCCTR